MKVHLCYLYHVISPYLVCVLCLDVGIFQALLLQFEFRLTQAAVLQIIY